MRTEAVCELLVEVSDQVIMPRFGSLALGDIEEKKPGDLVTVADREAEDVLSLVLAAEYPGALIVGEEGVFGDPTRLDALAGAQHAWVIDPVDGTRNFSRGSPEFAVMLAELWHGETVRAWIWQPAHSRMYVAERGAGVVCNGEPMRNQPTGRRVPLGATYLPLRGEAEASVDIRRSWGSCGIDYPKLIDGEVDFLSYRSMFPWDHLPGALMVREFGGRIASEQGVEYAPGVIGRRLIAAMTPRTWTTVRDALVLIS
ncbi:MAG: inositol monophosphatase [Propionicimonas sp.]